MDVLNYSTIPLFHHSPPADERNELDSMATELSTILAKYADFEMTVRQQITDICAPHCTVCQRVCCRPEYCRENINSPFLNRISAKSRPNRAFSDECGWLAPTGCALSAGRPPVCYQFNCNKIIDGLPTDQHRYLFRVLSNLVPYIGKRSLGTRHLVEIMDPAQLRKVSLKRFSRRLNEARDALHVIQSFKEPDFSKASSLAALSRVVPIPRILAE
jgi:hypothetical protein